MLPGFIEINGLNLFYSEQNEDAPCTIFFLHGNSCSSYTWRKQLNSPLLSAYRLIAFDLPAHGKSEASDTLSTDYSLPGLAKIMADAVNQLHKNNPYIIVSISLATNILAEMLPFLPAASGIVLAGPCVSGPDYPLGVIIKKGADPSAVFMDDATEEHILKYALETSASRAPEDIEAFLKDYHNVKGPFRSSLFNTISAGEYNDQIALLRQANLPMLGVFGLDERVVDDSYLDHAPLQWWNGSIYKIPGGSHLVNIDQPAEFNRLLQSFALDIFK